MPTASDPAALAPTVISSETRNLSSSGPSSSRIPELDGLRGFAILIVVLLHYFYTPGSSAPPAYRHFQSLFRLGWVGVDLFFILSGFLIGGILIKARSAPHYFRAFYARRFFRIIPVYYAWIIAYILLVAIFGGTLRAHTNSGVSSPLGFGIYQHFLFLQNIWAPPYVGLALWWFGVMWSLAVEEQFYLIAPLLIRYLSERTLYVALVLICLAAPLLRTFLYFTERPLPWHAVASTLCRADSLALGVLAALLWRSDRFRAWLSARLSTLYALAVVLFAGMLFLWAYASNPYSAITLTVGFSWVAAFFFVVLLLALIHPAGPLARFARSNWLRELGRVSYCVYLIHVGILYVGFGLIFRSIPHISDAKTIALAVFCAACTYAVAQLSWRFFESPLINRGHSFSYSGAAS